MSNRTELASVTKKIDSFGRYTEIPGWVSRISVGGMIFFGVWLALNGIAYLASRQIFEHLPSSIMVSPLIGIGISLAGFMTTLGYRLEQRRQFEDIQRRIKSLNDRELYEVARTSDHARKTILRCLVYAYSFRGSVQRAKLRPGQRKILAASRLSNEFETGYERAQEIFPYILEAESKYADPEMKESPWKLLLLMCGPFFLVFAAMPFGDIATFVVVGLAFLPMIFKSIHMERTKGFTLPLPYEADVMADLALLGHRYALNSLVKRKKENEKFKQYATHYNDLPALRRLRTKELLALKGIDYDPTIKEILLS